MNQLLFDSLLETYSVVKWTSGIILYLLNKWIQLTEFSIINWGKPVLLL